MFKRNKRKIASIDTWVGKNTRMQGDVRFSGGLHVDGQVTGNIVADDSQPSVFELSETGQVEGHVRAPTVILAGRVDGDVYATERLEMAAGASINGDVHYQQIEMAIGAEINGKMIHSGAVAQRQEEGSAEGADARTAGHLKAVE